MQISKINMFNTKSNTIQNNNPTQPLYRNTNNSDSVSFSSRETIIRRVGGEIYQFLPGSPEVMAKLEAIPFLEHFPDIAGRACVSGKEKNSGVCRQIENPDEIRTMAITIAKYIESKVSRIAEILQQTHEHELPISDLGDRNAPGISFKIYPNTSGKSFDYYHNDKDGRTIEHLAFRDGQTNYYSRTLQDHDLSLHFLDGDLYRIAKYEDQRLDGKEWGETMCLDKTCLPDLFNLPPFSIKTPLLLIKK